MSDAVKSIVKGYSAGGGGQVHWRMRPPVSANSGDDLYCLHPSPYSGAAFDELFSYLDHSKRIIAPDYPGYGGSDALETKASIEDYALGVDCVVDDLSANRPVDLLGFHTGCLVAVELALQKPEKVHRLILIDCPFFSAEDSERHLKAYGSSHEISSDLECLRVQWDRAMMNANRGPGVDRSYQLFSESVRAGAGVNDAFAAAFSYPSIKKFSAVRHPTIVVATQSSLLEATRNSARRIPGATLVEQLDVSYSVLDHHAQQVAVLVNNFMAKSQ